MNKINIIVDHHNFNTTIVIGDYCLNGCQIFNKEDAESIFRAFCVTQKHQQDVRDLFTEYDPNQLIDLSVLDTCVLYIGVDVVKLLLEHFKTPQVIDYLLHHKCSEYTTMGISEYSEEEQNKLINSDNAVERQALVSYCSTKLLDKLYKDKNWVVRWEVAKRGKKEHLDYYLHDENVYVREEVARHGFKEHFDVLVTDPKPNVRYTAALSCDATYCDKFVNDKDDGVRFVVALRSNNKEILNILANDTNCDVSEAANIRLGEM